MNLVASALQRFRARLESRPDSEHEQAILRVILLGLITGFMWYHVQAGTRAEGDDDRLVLTGLIGFFVLAVGLFGSICIWPGRNIPRRVLGMLADSGATTFALFLTGHVGVFLIGVFLFITFGNGFRYGRKHLLLCQALCLAGFVPVVLWAPWWRDEPYIGWGLVALLTILPLYVSTLLKRLIELIPPEKRPG